MNDEQIYEIQNSLGTGTFTIKKVGNEKILLKYNGNDNIINVPESLTSIGNRAFSYCNNLTKIKLPESLTSIGVEAFSSCSNLIEIKLPESLTSVGDGAFSNCENLTEIKLPESLTSIGVEAFFNCSNLTKIKLPESLTIIGVDTFYNCSNLTEIKLPESLTIIGGDAFYNCSNLTEIKLPEGLTIIGNSAFSYCSNLTEIKLPESLTSIGNRAFSYCSNLTKIKLPESLTSIEDGTFSNCSNLTEIKLPESLTSIGDGAFSDCENLTEIKYKNFTFPISFFNNMNNKNIKEWVLEQKKELPIIIRNHMTAETILKKIFQNLKDNEIANFISLYNEENFLKNVDLLQKMVLTNKNDSETIEEITDIILRNKNFSSIDIEETALKNYEYLVGQKIIDEKFLQKLYFEYDDTQLLSQILKDKTLAERKEEIGKILKKYYNNQIGKENRIPDLLFTLCIENTQESKLELRDRLLATVKLENINNLDSYFTKLSIKNNLKLNYFNIIKKQDDKEIQKLTGIENLREYQEINYFDGIKVSLHKKIEAINQAWLEDFYEMIFFNNSKLLNDFANCFDVTKEWNSYSNPKERAAKFRNEFISRILYTSLNELYDNNKESLLNDSAEELIKKIRNNTDEIRTKWRNQKLTNVIKNATKSSEELFTNSKIIEAMINLNPYSYDTVKKLDLSEQEKINYASIALKNGYLFSARELEQLNSLEVSKEEKNKLERKMSLKNYIEYINNEIGIKKIPLEKREDYLKQVKNITEQYCLNSKEEDLFELLRMSDLYLRENTEIGIQMYESNDKAKELVEQIFDYQNQQFNNTDRLLFSLYNINQIAHNSESIALSVELLEENRFTSDNEQKSKYNYALKIYNELNRLGISIKDANAILKLNNMIEDIMKYQDPNCNIETKSKLKDELSIILNRYHHQKESITEENFNSICKNLLQISNLNDKEKEEIKIFSDEANTFFEVKRVIAKTAMDSFIERVIKNDIKKITNNSSLFLTLEEKQEFFKKYGYVIEIQGSKDGPTLVCYNPKFMKPFSIHLKDLSESINEEYDEKKQQQLIEPTIYHTTKETNNLGLTKKDTQLPLPPSIKRESFNKQHYRSDNNNSKFIKRSDSKVNIDFACILLNYLQYDYICQKNSLGKTQQETIRTITSCSNFNDIDSEHLIYMLKNLLSAEKELLYHLKSKILESKRLETSSEEEIKQFSSELDEILPIIIRDYVILEPSLIEYKSIFGTDKKTIEETTEKIKNQLINNGCTIDDKRKDKMKISFNAKEYEVYKYTIAKPLKQNIVKDSLNIHQEVIEILDNFKINKDSEYVKIVTEQNYHQKIA